MKLEVKQNDKENGLIVVHCLYKVVSLLFWKCFGEELLIEIKSNQKNETQVCVFMVPNFFRLKVGKGERLTNLTELLSEINKGGKVIRK